MMTELSRREKEANIKPDPDLDVFMKVVYITAGKYFCSGKIIFVKVTIVRLFWFWKFRQHR